MVDGFVGAEFAGLGEFCFGAGGGDHARAGSFCDLQRHHADAAACGEDEDSFRGLERGASDYHVPRGGGDEWERGGVFVRERGGNGDAVRCGDFYKFDAAAVNALAEDGEGAAEIVGAGETFFAEAAGNSGMEEDAVAGFDAG